MSTKKIFDPLRFSKSLTNNIYSHCDTENWMHDYRLGEMDNVLTTVHESKTSKQLGIICSFCFNSM